MTRFRIVKSIRRRGVLMLLLLSAIVIYILSTISVFARIENHPVDVSDASHTTASSRGFFSFLWDIIIRKGTKKKTTSQLIDTDDHVQEGKFNITPNSQGIADFWYAKVNAEWAYWPMIGYCRGNKSLIEDIHHDICYRRSCVYSTTAQDYVDIDKMIDKTMQKDVSFRLTTLRWKWQGELKECRQPTGGQLTLDTSSTSPQISFVFILHDQIEIASQVFLEVFRTAFEAKSMEWIVIDDGSREDMTAVQSVLQSVRELFGLSIVTIRHQQRMGYLASLQLALRHAKGEYVMLLNSGILPLPGWLTMLLQSMERHRKDKMVVMIGPLVLDRQGRVKEAGASLYQDQTVSPVAKGSFPSELSLQQARFVDLLSAKCLLIKRSFLLDAQFSLDGSDAPSSAMYIRLPSTARLLFQPLSVVVDVVDTTTQQEFQLLNIIPANSNDVKTLVPVYCPAPPTTSVTTKTSSMARDMTLAFYQQPNRVLFLEDLVPEIDRESGAIRLWELLHLLVDFSYSVSFEAQPTHNRDVKYILPLLAHGVNVMMPGSLHALAQNVQAFPPFQSLPASVKRQLCPWDLIIMARRVVLDRHWQDVHVICPHVPIIYDTIDLHFIRELRSYAVKYNLTTEELEEEQARVKIPIPSRRLKTGRSKIAKAKDKRTKELNYILQGKTRELQYMQQSNITFVVSQDEEQLIHQILGNLVDVRVISNIYQVDEKESIPSAEERSGAIFVGNMCHLPNLDAVDFIMTSILKDSSVFPNHFRMHFVWSRSRLCNHLILEEAEKHPLVIVHRDISNVELLQLHQQVKMVLAPLRYGAGVKGKVNYALLHGVPVIATRMASEGMGLTHEVNCLLAESGEEFIQQIVRLQHDDALHQQLSSNGQTLMRELFSREVARKKLIEALQDLQLTPRTSTSSVFQCPHLNLYEEHVIEGWEDYWQLTTTARGVAKWSGSSNSLYFPMYAGLAYDQPSFLRSLVSS